MTGAFLLGGGGNGAVQSVTAGDASITVSGTSTNPVIEAGTLDQIATLHPPAAAVPLNGKKITGLANGSASTDAAAFGQLPVITAADSSIVVAGTAAAPTIAAQLTRPQAAKYSAVSGQAPRESIPFWTATGAVTATAGIMFLSILPVSPGDVITNLGFVVNGAATFGSSGYHWWVALYDATAANLIAQSADQTNTALGAGTAHMLALGTGAPYTVPSAVYELYAGVMINVGTGGSPANPTLRGPFLSTSLFDSTTSLFPSSRICAATNGTGLGATAPAGPLTLAVNAGLIYFGAD